MEALHNLVSWKKRDSRWGDLCKSWKSFVYLASNKSYPKDKISKLWEEWCKACIIFECSGKKPPRSGKQRAKVWRELYMVAKHNFEVLEEINKAQKDLNEQTQQQQKVQKDLEEQMLRHKTKETYLESKIQELVTENEKTKQSCLALEKKVLFVRQQLEESKAHVQELEMNEEKWRSEASKYKNNFERVSTDFQDLQKAVKMGLQIISKESKTSNTLKAIIDHIESRMYIPPGAVVSKTHGYDGDKNMILSHSSALLEVKNIADIMGPITDKNLMQWLYRWQQGQEVENWTSKDLPRVLFQCMTLSAFSLLPSEVKRGEVSWLVTCKHVVACLIPESMVTNIFPGENMLPDESVMQYFNRVWMEYQIFSQTDNISRDDEIYKTIICKGLDRELLKEARIPIQHIYSYNIIEDIMIIAEISWKQLNEYKQHPNWFRLSKKEGVGCPPRRSIWYRIAKYEDPCITVQNASYWQLVVRLSKFEELDTRLPR